MLLEHNTIEIVNRDQKKLVSLDKLKKFLLPRLKELPPT